MRRIYALEAARGVLGAGARGRRGWDGTCTSVRLGAAGQRRRPRCAALSRICRYMRTDGVMGRSRRPWPGRARTSDVGALLRVLCRRAIAAPAPARSRTVFTLEDWKRHRTSDRYGRHIGSIFRSGIVRALLPASLWYAFDGAFFALWGTLQASTAYCASIEPAEGSRGAGRALAQVDIIHTHAGLCGRPSAGPADPPAPPCARRRRRCCPSGSPCSPTSASRPSP